VEEDADQVFTLSNRRRSERRSTPTASQVTPSAHVEAADNAVAETMAVAAHRADGEDNNATQISTDGDEYLEQDGRTWRGRATADGNGSPFLNCRRLARAGVITHEGRTTDADV